MTTINRQITTRPEVAELVTEPEGPTLDYKSKAHPDEWWELAKDIAAFANHLGGVIVVGAHEQDDGLPSIQGFAPDRVAELATAYENAARDKCRPQPIVTCVPIPWAPDREVLAVNVQAYAGGLVGARFYAADKNGKNQAANAWQFVMRVGKHNAELPLEMAIMHMSTHARRTAILLSAIPADSHISLTLRWPAEEDTTRVPVIATLKAFSVESNTIDLALHSAISAPQHGVPLDDVEAVWTDGGRWCVRIAGYFEHWNDRTGAPKTSYIPCPRIGA